MKKFLILFLFITYYCNGQKEKSKKDLEADKNYPYKKTEVIKESKKATKGEEYVEKATKGGKYVEKATKKGDYEEKVIYDNEIAKSSSLKKQPKVNFSDIGRPDNPCPFELNIPITSIESENFEVLFLKIESLISRSSFSMKEQSKEKPFFIAEAIIKDNEKETIMLWIERDFKKPNQKYNIYLKNRIEVKKFGSIGYSPVSTDIYPTIARTPINSHTNALPSKNLIEQLTKIK